MVTVIAFHRAASPIMPDDFVYSCFVLVSVLVSCNVLLFGFVVVWVVLWDGWICVGALDGCESVDICD